MSSASRSERGSVADGGGDIVCATAQVGRASSMLAWLTAGRNRVRPAFRFGGW